MIDSRMITFFSLLALLCLAFLVVVVPISLWSLARGGVPEPLKPWRDALGQTALWMAFAVAAVTTFGSLWLSEAENLPPCILCWYQRICMYPNAVILLVAAIRRDVSVKWYSLPLVLIGASISTWHYLLERFPDSAPKVCSEEIPCETVWIWKYHFLSIPAMAWIAFLTIAVLVLVARPAVKVGGRGVTVESSAERELVP
jgi:disulfide bond formation protein DsbB